MNKDYETLDDVDASEIDDSKNNLTPDTLDDYSSIDNSIPDTLDNNDNLVNNTFFNNSVNSLPNQTFNGNTFLGNNSGVQNNNTNEVNSIIYVKKNPVNGFLIFLVILLAITLVAVLVYYNKDKIFKSNSSSSSNTTESSSTKDSNDGDKSDSNSVVDNKTDEKNSTGLDTSVKGLLKDACSKNLVYNESYPNGELSCLSGVCSYTDKSYNMYSMICATGEYTEQAWGEMQANMSLSTMCSVLDSNGNYVSTGNGKCENFTCYYEVDGKTYSKVCK